MNNKGRFYEDFHIGEKFVTLGKTITEADIIYFAAFSGNHDPMHTDKEFCRQRSPYGETVAHDLLGLVVQGTLSHDLGITEGTTMLAFLGMEWKFIAPIRAGDTVHVKMAVVEKRKTRKEGRGIVTIESQLRNQHDEVVQKGTKSILVACKDYKYVSDD